MSLPECKPRPSIRRIPFHRLREKRGLNTVEGPGAQVIWQAWGGFACFTHTRDDDTQLTNVDYIEGSTKIFPPGWLAFPPPS